MLNVFLGIIAIAGIVYLCIIFWQKCTVKQANKLYESKHELGSIPLNDEFKLANDLRLTGESKQKYDNLLSEYENLRGVTFPDIEEGIKLVNEDGKGINFIKTRRDLNLVHNMMEDADLSIKEIQANLAQLHELNKQHHLLVKDLEIEYENLKSEISEHKEEILPSFDAIQLKMDEANKTFLEFSTLTENGDHDKAEKVLGTLNNEIIDIKNDMKNIPSSYDKLKNVFPVQIDELKKGYNFSVNQKINFKDDNFNGRINNLNELINQSYEALSQLDLETSQSINTKIATIIDEMYARIEKEYSAQKRVEKNTKKIDEYLEFIRKQNVSLTRTLTKMNSNYVLDHSETENNRQITEQIKNIAKTVNDDKGAMKDGDAIYSLIDEQQSKTIKTLKQIKDTQDELYNSLIELPSKEQNATQALKEFDLEMRNCKRHLDSLNLPGMPNDYTEQFNGVIKEITKLDTAMNLPKINIDEISKQLIIIQSDMDNLNEYTDKLTDNAILAEQALQFSNRFVHSSETIATARIKAKEYFDKKFEYSKSLTVIATALENEQSGSFQKIENEYFAKKNNPNKLEEINKKAD